MSSDIIDVYTTLDPATLTDVAYETFRQWLAFALGRSEIGGKTLAHPSGRYAASLSWHKVGVSAVAIIADENVAPEANWIEHGTTGADIKNAMLSGAKLTADGYHYRRVPMRAGSGRGAPAAALDGFSMASIMQSNATGTGGGTTQAFAGMWGERRENAEPDRVRTMTDRPGSADWKVPAFQPYSPAATLASLLRAQYSNG